MWRMDDPQGGEAEKVKYDLVPFTRGIGLDLGCGPKKAFPHFIGVDSCKDTELFGIQMKPDIRVDTCEKLPDFEDEANDFVFSSHLLEHIVDTVPTLKEWWRVLKVGGHLCLYLPHKDFYPNIGTPGANPDHVHDFHPDDIIAAMRRVGNWSLVLNEERNGGMEYSFLQVYRKEPAGDVVQRMEYRHVKRPPKTACVVRYGGYGDMIQASNLFPALAREGYHITVMTTPSGQEIVANDPHVNDWIIQDKDQVPNHELVDYWKAWAKRFDRFINLSESVEGTLLALPGRTAHAWPHAVRHKYLNTNYLEFTSELGGVAYKSEARFYPTAEEKAWADAFVAEQDSFLIMWVLAGSSPNKLYVHMDEVIMDVLASMPNAKVILVGGMLEKLLESGWENEDRVIKMAGELDIRKTLALAQQCQMVIGPETGVLNAVAFEENSKVVFMSHSSVENLTKHWVNTFSLQAYNTPCYPCHQLHVTTEYCPVHPEMGSSACQLDIAPGRVYAAIDSVYEGWYRVKSLVIGVTNGSKSATHAPA